MLAKIKKWKRRVWLNPLTSGDNGYIITGQETDEEAFLKIADCTRLIELNLWYNSKKEKKDVTKKLNILIKEITFLKERIEKSE